MPPTFGTDGVRGPADDLTDDLVAALGVATARVFGASRVLIGRDTRASGPRIERALAAGLAAAGAEPVLLGVAPTPAVAWAAAAHDVPAAMVSASHNPWSDNGIKVFAPGGRKLPDAQEAELAAAWVEARGHPVALDAATVVGDGSADVERWALALGATLDGRDLSGLSVVLDCANGAASSVAPQVLERLGATVHVLFADPDGRNINEGCGSTHPEALATAVVERGAAVGLAFDGDADRVLAVDHTGALVDGDQILAVCARDLHDRGLLPDATVVVTVMSNLGFRLAMDEAGLTVVETPVGDRHVLEAMAAGGHLLGGEQSGHVIFARHATTGDGLLTGLSLLDVVHRSGRSLAELAAGAMTRLPQVLRNVAVARRDPDVARHLAGAIAAEESVLGDHGRVLVRPSGTEPLVRVMVEAPDAAVADAVAARLAEAVLAVCGAPGSDRDPA